MSDVQIENLEKNQIKLTFTVTADEAQPYLEEAATRLSEDSSIPGFRPGKASYDVIKQRFGEMKIHEEALEAIVRKSFVEAVLANDIETVGSPKIDVQTLAPGNDIVFTAEITRMPQITKLVDYKNHTVKAKEAKAEEKDIDLALRDLQRMQTKEVRAEKDSVVGDGDKIVVSMDMKLAGVSVEGGQSPNHAIFMNEDYYIPGLKEQVKGMKEGEKKTFTLPFPKEHVQKMLAGKDVEFEVTVKELFNLQPPALDDIFAKSLGLGGIDALRETLEKNITDEKIREEQARQEKEALEHIAEKSTFEDIPDLLLNEEVNKMIMEFQRNVESQGVEFDQYLKNMNKTLAELKIDFTPQALTRIKVALAMKVIAKQEEITISEKEVDEELDRIAAQYEDKEMQKKVYSPQYREYAEHMLKNRKVIEHLVQTMIK